MSLTLSQFLFGMGSSSAPCPGLPLEGADWGGGGGGTGERFRLPHCPPFLPQRGIGRLAPAGAPVWGGAVLWRFMGVHWRAHGPLSGACVGPPLGDLLP